jgi:hypothetical protein
VERAVRAEAGVGDDNRRRLAGRVDGVAGRPQALLGRQVGDDRRGGDPVLAPDQGRELLQPVRAAGDQQQAVPARGEALGVGPSQPGRGPRDDREAAAPRAQRAGSA